jgi:hypothetical protein
MENNQQSNTWKLPILNLIFYIINTVVTFVSITGAFGKTNTELSEKYQTLVTPEGYAFSIWGLIFTAEGIFVLAQLFYSPLRESSVLSQGVGYWWIAACVAQAAWTFAFAQEVIWLSCIFMLSIWVALSSIVYNTYFMKYTLTEFWTLVAPFQLHFGWITAASFVNVNVLVVEMIGCYKGNYLHGCSEKDVGTQIASAIVSLALIFMFGLWLSGVFGLNRVNPITTGVLSWATIAIYVQLQNAEDDFVDFYNSLGLGAAPLTDGLGRASLVVGIVLAIGVLLDILSLVGLTPRFDFSARGQAEVDNGMNL